MPGLKCPCVKGGSCSCSVCIHNHANTSTIPSASRYHPVTDFPPPFSFIIQQHPLSPLISRRLCLVVTFNNSVAKMLGLRPLIRRPLGIIIDVHRSFRLNRIVMCFPPLPVIRLLLCKFIETPNLPHAFCTFHRSPSISPRSEIVGHEPSYYDSNP